MNQLREIVRAEIHATADELRLLKRWLRTPLDHRPDRPSTSFALLPLQRRATLLCMIMAHSRGRIHRKPTTLDDQRAELRLALDELDTRASQPPLLEASVRGAARAILIRRDQIALNPATACVAPTEEYRA
jgi:hypothetical protein